MSFLMGRAGGQTGMLRVPGVMPPKCKMFDTPGVPHKFQLTSRLQADEVRGAHQSSCCKAGLKPVGATELACIESYRKEMHSHQSDICIGADSDARSLGAPCSA